MPLSFGLQGVRNRYQSASDISSTLESLVQHDSEESQMHGTKCLVRLMRYVM